MIHLCNPRRRLLPVPNFHPNPRHSRQLAVRNPYDDPGIEYLGRPQRRWILPLEVECNCAGVITKFKAGDLPDDEVGDNDGANDDQGAEAAECNLNLRVLRQWLAR